MTTWLKATLAVVAVAAMTALGCALVFEPDNDGLWVLAFVVLIVVFAASRRGSWNAWWFGMFGTQLFGSALFFVGAIRTGVVVTTQVGADGWSPGIAVLFLAAVLPLALLGGVFLYGAVRAATFVDDETDEDVSVTTDVRA